MTIAETRATVGPSIGLPDDFDGSVSAYADLGQAQQIQLAEAVDVYINAHPSQFTAAQVMEAQRRVQAPGFGKPVADASLLASAEELPGAMLDSAQNLVNATGNTIKYAIYIAAAVGIVFAIIRYGPGPKKAAAP